MHSKVLVVFTVIDRATLEESINYLACPSDKKELKLNINNSDLISEGEFECSKCGGIYEIRDGVPYFFEKGNGYEWKANISRKAIAEKIAESLSDKDQTWSMIVSLGSMFLDRTKDRRKAIESIFNVIEEVIKLTQSNSETVAELTQAATAARYDIEIYRGTFKLPEHIAFYLQDNYDVTQGIILEGACANGDCLLELEQKIDSNLYLGLDISGSMVREAQRKAQGKMLFVQGDICRLPLKKNSAGVYVLNNVFDRVVNPFEACAEADYVLKSEQSFLVLSNCDPLQFSYTTEKGDEIIFVPEDRQLSLEQGLLKAGFNKVREQKGDWKIETAAYGRETLPYRSIVGRR